MNFLTGGTLRMSGQMENQKTTGKRLRAWRKSVPLKLMQLSHLIKVSQGSLSDLENDKSLPSATTLANLSTHTDLNIFWLLTGKGPVSRKLSPDMEKSTEQSRLYEDFMYMMQDRKLKGVVEKVIGIHRDGDAKKKAQIQGFLSALS
ncbi:MAG: helix-turn-helix transcriptional regulator [Nitrospina sp.]|jgi:transcriptional regulator with XRE-family HTH domain|nr:helix-turn-helix transcriptional regulator [Nitrospina sp.]MBT3875494.1 helix-turn-helix transcriptional regulator [Nitrospina sp.]MBT4048850.1 helix-turn-helix transcriptional regulator [Nitrospina sp.]MBT4556977.1 helix-turn-helix transcriptional regulator [Nitrospina sp.]MBT5349628.1 helix-turn-helix transcriptional regulator [Nitrospina sp.]